MEPDVIRMYSSSPPPMEDGGEEEDDEFSNFTGVPNSISFSEFDTPTVFDQLQALNATSPPELIGNGRIMGLHGPAKCNGGIPLDSQVSDTCRTVNTDELKKEYTNCTDVSENARTDLDDVDRNGSVGGVEALTNGFSPFGAEESPPSCHKHRETEDSSPDAVSNNDDDDDFADFSAFSNADVPSRFDQESGQHGERDDRKERLLEDGAKPLESVGERVASTATDENARVTGFTSLAVSLEEPSESLSNGQWALHSEQRDLTTENAHLNSNTADPICTGRAIAQNGEARNSLEVKEKEEEHRASPISEDDRGGGSSSSSSEPTGNDTETETETETSFGRPLSTDALEEFGDFSTTGSVPSPPLQEETATPADHSQLAEEDDEDDFGDFGDFGDANSFGGAGFAEFDQQGAVARVEQVESAPRPEPGSDGEEKFGDFGVPTDAERDGQTDEREAEFANFPGSDSFADFTSAPVTVAAAADDDDGGGGWQAFNEPESSRQSEESWAAFGPDQGSAFSESSNKDWHEGHSDVEPPTEGSREDSGKDVLTASLISRLEKLFLFTFPEAEVSSLVLEVPPLKAFLQPDDRTERQESGAPSDGTLQGVWRQLQDVHNAFGLRHQWGGSHSNKTLLSSLGIDTRNILFTGQKKQPVIVPMYAASLGMLEPTKEPVKPVSAAEMIASIAQSPSVAAEMSSCPSDTVQESLPPVQFDWSSSGLTNPLDGVDPELYELTQVKLEVSGGSNVVADAFARLMSTVEKTNTSTRKVQKEENLSDEARQVISTLPDLSFMQAKVLMFPSTLTPLPRSSSAASPVPD